jgi:hypothetical protein
VDLLIFEAFAYFDVGACDIPALNAGAEIKREDCIIFEEACGEARSWLLDSVNHDIRYFLRIIEVQSCTQ